MRLPIVVSLSSNPCVFSPKISKISLRHFNKHLVGHLSTDKTFKTTLQFSLFRGLLSPFFWMYFSWTWLFWPWYIAVGLAVYGIYGYSKHIKDDASVVEQLAIVTAAFKWLTLVPPGYAHGFLEGWPFVFCFVYHYFFFMNVSIRKRLYGDFYVGEHDPKWDIATPIWQLLLFCVGMMVGHWFAAFEVPQLHLISGGWRNLGFWGLIISIVFLHYHSTLYLAKYSEKVVVPTVVVQFGPYRWIRHLLYASTRLLFLTYFIALHEPLSSLLLLQFA
ncbi:hypothetical protein QVD17_29213 [Tagetes erecta]|uniref:Uncharacterized protein n=2 Tax=Tagetes erecta TaxID=13708 RepID=A0AAD8NSS0_TARER|nr:hypothetical protein QVD17_29213 [Tagetes erecta]